MGLTGHMNTILGKFENTQQIRPGGRPTKIVYSNFLKFGPNNLKRPIYTRVGQNLMLKVLLLEGDLLISRRTLGDEVGLTELPTKQISWKYKTVRTNI